jgi:hypothetical protein
MSAVAPALTKRGIGAALAPHLTTALSAVAAICGITGTALLSIHPEQVLPVFALYLASSSTWIAVAALTRQPWLLCSNGIHVALALKALVF